MLINRVKKDVNIFLDICVDFERHLKIFFGKSEVELT